MGQAPLAAAASLRQAFGDKLCVYTVQVGDDAGGKQLLEKLATDGGCGEAVTADKINSGSGMGAFVESVFITEAADSDGDGVPDALDKCPDTPKRVKVDNAGCPFDSDGDGVPDYLDKCPGTAQGVEVGKWGCPVDSDGDGVADYNDKCPGTPKGAVVNEVGCWILGRILFDYDQAVIKPAFFPELDAALKVMNQNPGLRIEIQGHTDNKGSAKYNQGLSEKRAQAAMAYFLQKGIDPNRLSAKGYGLSRPIASNDTDEGRAMNRRVQLEPVY
jgi:OOP family OmpA-OmpF porin